ncbi:MAG: MBL fold metallo-hydrolase [archaeon]
MAKEIHVFYGKGLDCNTYVILAEKNVLIDPGLDVQSLRQEISSLGLKPEDFDYVLNTHYHFDHSSANILFKKVYAGSPDWKLIPNGTYLNKKILFDTFQVIKTPGHSKGSLSFLYDRILFCGDLLFLNGVGRTDLPGGSEQELKKSLKKVLSLDFDFIYPGHGPIGLKTKVSNFVFRYL